MVDDSVDNDVIGREMNVISSGIIEKCNNNKNCTHYPGYKKQLPRQLHLFGQRP